MLAQFPLPLQGCSERNRTPGRQTLRCPFFRLDVAGGVWSCKCALADLSYIGDGGIPFLHPEFANYHVTRPSGCPFDSYPHSLELQAELIGDPS